MLPSLLREGGLCGVPVVPPQHRAAGVLFCAGSVNACRTMSLACGANAGDKCQPVTYTPGKMESVCGFLNAQYFNSTKKYRLA